MKIEWFNKWRAQQTLYNSRYRTQLADLPPALEPYWRQSAPHEYQGIPTDAFFFARAAEGLMNFFDAVTWSAKACALPSEAADSVWHAWLRIDPISLERFCKRHFGAAVPHVERDGLASGALLNTFTACHTLDGGMPDKPHLPSLFRLDARLRMRDGHGYWLHGGRIVYARTGPYGMGLGRAMPHPELTMGALYMAGLVDRGALAAELGRRRPAQDSGGCGGDAGFAFIDGGGDDGSGCGDGGGDGGSGDGGSSCGSSCGGGCGGGRLIAANKTKLASVQHEQVSCRLMKPHDRHPDLWHRYHANHQFCILSVVACLELRVRSCAV